MGTLWQDIRYGVRTLMKNPSFTVVGVMPAGFRFPGHSELWLPYPVDAIKPTERGGWCARVIARLKPEVNRAQAQAEMDVIADRLAQAE